MPEGFSLVANTLPPTCPASLGRSRAKSGRDLAEPRDVCLECLCVLVLTAMGEVLTEWVAGSVPPPGAFNGIGAKLVILASSVCWVLGNLPRLYRVTGHLPLGGLSLASLASVPTSQVFCIPYLGLIADLVI